MRLELLNDPNLPLGGPGRSIYGTCALTEFRLEAGPADDSAKMAEVKIAAATADVNPPEKELESIFDDKNEQAPRHRADRVCHRPQGRNGLEHRHRPRPQQRAAQGRVSCWRSR